MFSPGMLQTNPIGTTAGTVGLAAPGKPISPWLPYLFGGLLHDVNNTLAVLMCWAELRTMSPPEMAREVLSDVDLKGRLLHVAKVVQLMQTLARDRYLPGSPGTPGMAHRWEELLAQTRSAEPGIAVEGSCDPRVEQADLPDALVLFIAGELLQNARRACAGCERPRIDLGLVTEPADNTVLIRCQDTGAGFSPAQLEAIRGGRLKPPASGSQGGYGLYFVTEIAFRLEGAVLVSNREEGGARVEVLLPYRMKGHA